MSMSIEPDGFIAFTQKYCSCNRCKSIVRDCVPLQMIQECSQCNERYAYLLKTNITDQQLCEGCYIAVVGFEQARLISAQYRWLHPFEYELWGVQADDLGFLMTDTKTKKRFFVPLPEAQVAMTKNFPLIYRPRDGRGRETLQRAKILCDPSILAMADEYGDTIEARINWDDPASCLTNEEGADHISDATTVKGHGNSAARRKARRERERQEAVHDKNCKDCKPSLKERLFGKKKKEVNEENAKEEDWRTIKGTFAPVEREGSMFRSSKVDESALADVLEKQTGQKYTKEELKAALERLIADGKVELTEDGYKLSDTEIEKMKMLSDKDFNKKLGDTTPSAFDRHGGYENE